MGERNMDASELREVHLLLAQGKSEQARGLLLHIAGAFPTQHKELIYLQAWDAAVQEQWEMVAQQVRGDIPALLPPEEWENLLTHGSIRRRRPICLLILGEMARELGYPEEATEHLQHCLTLLNERRMNIPEVRLLAHCSMGQLSLHMNQTAQALIQYEKAKSLYADEETEKPLFITLLIGLCETYVRLEQFEKALSTGKQALRLLQAKPSAGCQEHILLMLSRISLSLNDHASALAYAQEAREVASQINDQARVANALLVLAEILQKMCQVQEARTSSQQALALLSVTQEQALYGAALFLCGKIAEDEWRLQPAQETLAEEALLYYKQARTRFEELHNAPSLAKVSKQLAQLLEARGQPELALTHWKNAYTLANQR
jgi:tetratricopeptide (TPR) repeat protein